MKKEEEKNKKRKEEEEKREAKRKEEEEKKEAKRREEEVRYCILPWKKLSIFSGSRREKTSCFCSIHGILLESGKEESSSRDPRNFLLVPSVRTKRGNDNGSNASKSSTSL